MQTGLASPVGSTAVRCNEEAFLALRAIER